MRDKDDFLAPVDRQAPIDHAVKWGAVVLAIGIIIVIAVAALNMFG